MNTADSCSDLSGRAGEPLAGTAEPTDCWVLLEYPEPWGAAATTDNTLPQVTRDWLDDQLAALRGLGLSTRLQFIRQQQLRDKRSLSLFVVHNDPVDPRIHRFQFNSHAELDALDLPGLWQDPAAYAEHRFGGPLFCVCTNGQRDQCCSVHGMRVYAELSRQVGDAAWQTTHLGGHRFAATLVAFPSGAVYGRVGAQDVAALVQAENEGKLVLQKLRGRSCWPKDVQAAEYFLRERTGLVARTRFRFVECESRPPHDVFTFEDLADRGRHQVVLKRQKAPLHFYPSCGEPGFKSRWLYYPVNSA